ncbi:Aste57867_2927 [Aphanomyces stellatus]|uniref:Aste57867_2927 protein n=1 Tax=Aphanomyces stellatus TaxID=120398 RepID=A0A485KB46_9STRA|nr:hypothetical protein As57867_002919 [Aphanomyces stellatus]VFT80110.1 Aste57867_2927 [Aphanomyces stellatus]
MLSPAQLIVAASIAAVAAHDYFPAESPEYNIKAINTMLHNTATVRKPGQAFALYDWDNTCMYGDISETSIHYQVKNLNFRIQPKDFETIFSMGYTANTTDACYPQGLNTIAVKSTTKNTTYAQLIQTTARDYANLYQAYIAPKYNLPRDPTAAAPLTTIDHAACGDDLLPGNMTLAQIQETTVFNNFAAKFGVLIYGWEFYNGADDFEPCAMKAGMTALPQALVGMTKDEIHAFIKASMRYNLNAAIGTKTFTSTEDKAITYDYPTGVRIFNGQEASMRAQRSVNMSVYVISASPQEFVEIAATHSGLTYQVSQDNLFGVRFQYTADGKFTGQLVDESKYPISWGAGKAWISKNLISPRHGGAAPLFVSGDANGDCGMMDLTRDGVVMVNNRLKANTNCIQKFYEKACQFYGSVDPETKNQFIMQGQDKEMGSWINSGFTTKNGKDYSSGTSTSCDAYKTFF